MTAKFLRVAVPSPLYRSFDYRHPDRPVTPGSRVRVPFGRGQRIAVALESCDNSPVAADRLRSVLEVLDEQPVLPDELMTLANWAQRYYHHPIGDAYTTLLPVLLRQGLTAEASVDLLWRITPEGMAALQAGIAHNAHRQRRLLGFLAAHCHGVVASELTRELPGWTATAKSLVKKGWLESLASPLPIVSARPPSLPILNSDQAEAVTAVCEAGDGFAAFLLDGVTGSGKTEVYLRIIASVLARRQQALVLVPEIGLTPQLLARFRSRFTEPLAVLHSGLNDRERLNAWLSAGQGEARIVIGTRSAIFTPMPALGVIVIDEEHDLSFKQQDGFRYNARDLAIVRARQHQVPVVLGSATPSLESLENVQRNRYRQLRLPGRAGQAVAPTIELLDIRRQFLDEGLSKSLLARMRSHLDRDDQVLLFLNRRGFAPTLSCNDCGWLSQCERCDARMTLHKRRNRLLCHHCAAERPVPIRCPDCDGDDIRPLGQGTERIEQVLKQEFADVGVVRIDRDSTRRKGSLEAMLAEVHRGGRRILIGTQMLAKGHDFPDVTLVGIINTDQGLFGADFRSEERMAQLILQVAGRAGRAEKPGTVVIQTRYPDHPLLNLLVRQGYGAFAAEALRERQAAHLPPYSCQALLRAEATEPDLPQAFLNEAVVLADQHDNHDVELLGPIPAPMERRAGRYRAQLLIQSNRRQPLHRFLNRWAVALGTLKNARQVRWTLDVDPLEML